MERRLKALVILMYFVVMVLLPRRASPWRWCCRTGSIFVSEDVTILAS